jgi:hypothetical protein
MTTFETSLLGINLLIHLFIFISSFYVALHNRIINKAIVTLLWYVGLASCFLGTTILVQFIFGENFPLSFKEIGTIVETIFAFIIALTLGVIFLLTVKTDFDARKKRRIKKN